MLDWLPAHPDFRTCIRAAMDSAGTDRIGKLVDIAQYDLGFLEVIQVERALGQALSGEDAGRPDVRLAILASSTVDQLVPAIRVAGLRRNLLFDVYLGQYGQYRQELLNPASPLYDYRPDYILLSLTAHEAVAGVSPHATREEVESTVDRIVGEQRMLWSNARTNTGATVIQQTFLNIGESLFGSYDRQVSGAPRQLIATLNERLAAAASEDNVLLLDIARESEFRGVDYWFDQTRWLQGKLAISAEASTLYGDLLLRVIAAQRGLSKKCLVLDLDNTLWGGVIGDDGLDGIVLGEGSALGEAHLALQRYAVDLKARGIILAVCSKNDPDIAASAFDQHPEMALRKSDIAAFVANWDDKSLNLQNIAKQLNIGIDSLVFVDDNPAERARIRESLPAVAVPELPDDPAGYVHCVASAGYFESVSFTADDRQRADQYAANASRQASLDSSQSMDEFLGNLDMSVVYGPVESVDLMRVAQLINKTNQFNTTTRRYTSDEVTAMLAEEHSLSIQFRLTDRFGDNGIVSAIILRSNGNGADTLDIDTWIMSCRVFGRQLEHEIMNITVDAARERGVRSLTATFIPTAKNKVISELYPELGFKQQDAAATDDGATLWNLDLADYRGLETHITRRSK